ncbi:hypothetical protein X773_30065 [Mesorhizobium sp. LSJC285A00]|nr:hypothetical protein X773_30065 [Mesorhizobium sp. LSJC285A00]
MGQRFSVMQPQHRTANAIGLREIDPRPTPAR